MSSFFKNMISDSQAIWRRLFRQQVPLRLCFHCGTRTQREFCISSDKGEKKMRVHQQRSVTKVFFCVLWKTFFFCCGSLLFACCFRLFSNSWLYYCYYSYFCRSLLASLSLRFFSRNSSTLSSSSACLLNPFLCLQVLLSSLGFWLIIIGGGFFHRGGALAGSGRAESRFHSVSIYLLRSWPCLLPRFILFPMVPFLLSFNQHFSGPSSLHPHDILRFHRFVCLWKQSLAYVCLLHALCCLTTLCSEI